MLPFAGGPQATTWPREPFGRGNIWGWGEQTCSPYFGCSALPPLPSTSPTEGAASCSLILVQREVLSQPGFASRILFLLSHFFFTPTYSHPRWVNRRRVLGYGGEHQVWLPKCTRAFIHPRHRGWRMCAPGFSPGMGYSPEPPVGAHSWGPMEHPSPCTGWRGWNGGKALSKALSSHPIPLGTGSTGGTGNRVEEEEQGLLSFPFVPEGAEPRGWRGKAARTAWEAPHCPPRRGFGEGAAGDKALSRLRASPLGIPGTRRTRARRG